MQISREQRFSRGEPEVSIVIPVYNEEAIIEEATNGLKSALEKEGIDFEIFLCENGSTDRTREIAEKIGRKYGRIHLISIDEPNYGKAMKAGFISSKGRYIFNFDIDYYSIDFLKTALKKLDNYDIVIGSKLAKGTVDNRPPLRKLITRGFSLILKFLFLLKITETHGIKGFRREKIDKLLNQTLSEKDLFDTELLIRAERNGLRITDEPVTLEERRTARSNILRRIPRTIWGLLCLRLRLWKEAFVK